MKASAFRTGQQIQEMGFAALVDKLGPGGALQFMLQYERGQGDYTKERKRLFRGRKLPALWAEINAIR